MLLVSCLLTIGAAWPALASQQSEQIPLVGSSASSHQQHAYHSNNASISAPLFVELEELARVVDISYCVGAYGVGIQNPFECPSRCAEFPSFELVTVSSSFIIYFPGCKQEWLTCDVDMEYRTCTLRLVRLHRAFARAGREASHRRLSGYIFDQ
jgi:hypothetical protein